MRDRGCKVSNINETLTFLRFEWLKMIIGNFFPFLADSIFIATYFSFFNFGRAWISEYPTQRQTYHKSNKDTKRSPTRSLWTLQIVQAHVEFCRQQNIHMLYIGICIQPLKFGGAYNMRQSPFVDISSGIRLLSWFSMDMTHYLHASNSSPPVLCFISWSWDGGIWPWGCWNRKHNKCSLLLPSANAIWSHNLWILLEFGHWDTHITSQRPKS